MFTGSEEEFVNDEMVAAVKRYEKMIAEADRYYFDVHEFEVIFDHYFSQKKYKQATTVECTLFLATLQPLLLAFQPHHRRAPHCIEQDAEYWR